MWNVIVFFFLLIWVCSHLFGIIIIIIGFVVVIIFIIIIIFIFTYLLINLFFYLFQNLFTFFVYIRDTRDEVVAMLLISIIFGSRTL